MSHIPSTNLCWWLASGPFSFWEGFCRKSILDPWTERRTPGQNTPWTHTGPGSLHKTIPGLKKVFTENLQAKCQFTESVWFLARSEGTESHDIIRHGLELLEVTVDARIDPGLSVIRDVLPDKVGGQHGHVVGQTPVLLQQLAGLTLQQAAWLLVLLEHLHRVNLRLGFLRQQTFSPKRVHRLDSIRSLRHCCAQAEN